MAASKRAFVALALALIVPAVTACQLVLGLDDYTTDGGAVNPGDAGLESDTSATDANVVPEVFAQQVDWAAWRMPNPAFDSGTDAQYNFGKVALAFTEISEAGSDATLGVYTDTYLGEDAGTGIYWIFTPALSGTTTVIAAETLCAARGGRLPSRIELVTLLDFTSLTERRMPGTSAFLSSARYWTSSPVRPYASDAGVRYWTVSFDPSNSTPVAPYQDGTNTAAEVVCVKGKKK